MLPSALQRSQWPVQGGGHQSWQANPVMGPDTLLLGSQVTGARPEQQTGQEDIPATPCKLPLASSPELDISIDPIA